MSRQFRIVLEYDGKNPIRTTFLCDISELEYSNLRNWEDLHDGDLNKYSYKKTQLRLLFYMLLPLKQQRLIHK